MSAPHSEGESERLGKGILHGRRLGPLLGPWITCVVIAGLVFYFETKMPAFHVVVRPVYWLLAVIVVIATVRALRGRAANRRDAERRHGDRRHHRD